MSTDNRAQVLAATDLVELISQSVALRRLGSKFKGLCPFHAEKTPSFTIDPAKGYFYCFGCKASGTAFDFVMKRDRVEFKDALEILAARAGIELTRGPGGKSNAGERKALLESQSAACRFFENQLNQPSPPMQAHQAAAMEYLLERRGFTEDSLKRFQVGLAADAWDALLRGPVGGKYGPQLLALGGLVKARDNGNGFYDTFRNRIMFPIRNEQGQIIGFGGRKMPGETDPAVAKYLNSPETPIYHKSKAIFGLDFARQRIVETRTVAVVEGYTDVMMAHQFGATNVVSPLGTALTPEHVNVLKRFADRIVLLFDADAAGDTAVDRVLQLFLTQEIEIAVATLPDGLDPDEFFLKYGLESFDKLLAGATDALSYAWKQMKKRFVSHDGDLTGQQKAIEEYLELVAGARGSGTINQVRWGLAIAGVSARTGIPAAELHRRFASKPAARPLRWPSAMNEQPVRGPVHPSLPVIHDASAKAERWVVGVLLDEPDRWMQVQAEIGVEDFRDPELRKLAQRIWDHQRDEGETVINEFLAVLPEESLRSLAIELAEEVERMQPSDGSNDATLKSALEHLDALRRKRQEEALLLRGKAEKTDNNAPSAGVVASQDEVELLKRIQEKARQPDLRRVGR